MARALPVLSGNLGLYLGRQRAHDPASRTVLRHLPPRGRQTRSKPPQAQRSSGYTHQRGSPTAWVSECFERVSSRVATDQTLHSRGGILNSDAEGKHAPAGQRMQIEVSSKHVFGIHRQQLGSTTLLIYQQRNRPPVTIALDVEVTRKCRNNEPLMCTRQ